MLITKDIAAKMESCIKQTHIEVTKKYAHGAILEINSGAACFSGFDSYLSQVVGWGFDTKPKQFIEELTAIEHFYKQLNHPRVDIEFCPFVGNPFMEMLSDRGYKVSEFNNISVLDLHSYKPHQLDGIQVGSIDNCSPPTFRGVSADSMEPVDNPAHKSWGRGVGVAINYQHTLREMDLNELDNWALTVALGFEVPEAQEQFSHYIRAVGTRTFGVFEDKQLVAGGTIAMHGEVCDLGVTSTLPSYRGRGLQKLLLIARLNFAKSQGLKLATVTTEPGSISDLNVQKLGFQCAYTRIKMTR